MAGDSFQRFTTFLNYTREKLLSDPRKLESQASKHRTYLLRDILRGLTKKEMVQSGTKIVDFVYLKHTSSFRDFNITDNFNFTGREGGTKIEAPWRMSMVYNTLHEGELDLNDGGTEATIFKRVKDQKDLQMELDWFEGIEERLWAFPNNATMEAASLADGIKGRAMSIPAYITEDGGAPNSTNSVLDTGSADFTTVLGVNPTDFPNWKNQFSTYNATDDTTIASTLIPAMDEMYMKVQYESPFESGQYQSDTNLNKQKILCNMRSAKKLVQLATDKNNVLTPVNDIGYLNGIVVYHNIPIRYVARLDTYDNTATTAASPTDAIATQKIKFWFVNFRHFKPIFHSKHYRRVVTKDGGSTNPYHKVMIEDTWYQFWNQNRREHGVVRPA
jgi:hypothetical protein